MDPIASISAIDVYGHRGVCNEAGKTPLYNQMMTRDAAEAVRQAVAVNVGLKQYVVIDPLPGDQG